LRIVLRFLTNGALGDLCDDAQERCHSKSSEIALDDIAGLVDANRSRHLHQHRPGIERDDHPHDGDAGLLVAVDDRTMHGSRAAVLRQQRRVHVDHAVLG